MEGVKERFGGGNLDNFLSEDLFKQEPDKKYGSWTKTAQLVRLKPWELDKRKKEVKEILSKDPVYLKIPKDIANAVEEAFAVFYVVREASLDAYEGRYDRLTKAFLNLQAYHSSGLEGYIQNMKNAGIIKIPPNECGIEPVELTMDFFKHKDDVFNSLLAGYIQGAKERKITTKDALAKYTTSYFIGVMKAAINQKQLFNPFFEGVKDYRIQLRKGITSGINYNPIIGLG